jgi:seryl-tRNA synthetase
MSGDYMTNLWGLQRKSKALTRKIKYFENNKDKWISDKMVKAKRRIQQQIKDKRKDDTKIRDRVKKLRD